MFWLVPPLGVGGCYTADPSKLTVPISFSSRSITSADRTLETENSVGNKENGFCCLQIVDKTGDCLESLKE
jgi:hypothetical protein